MRFLVLSLFICLSSLLPAQINFGVTVMDDPSPGYRLISPTRSNSSFLIDSCGQVVHSWLGSGSPGLAVYLTEDGSLVRTQKRQLGNISSGGSGGQIVILDWDSNLLLDYTLSNADYQLHHDVQPLSNGNILVIAWERIGRDEAIQGGRNEEYLTANADLWSEVIYELKPSGLNDVDIVWEWHAWDHIIQERSPLRDNFGILEDHPGKINLEINPRQASDWLHFNHIDYHKEKDLILISSRSASEIYIIDHSTTSAEAAGDAGGDYGRGGEILYRWGNPFNYGQGTIDDQVFVGQHAAQWIEHGGKQSDSIIVFNNGADLTGQQSAVQIIVPEVVDMEYQVNNSGKYLPESVAWDYRDTDILSPTTSAGYYQSNDRILITVGNKGTLVEVDLDKNIRWRYQNPVGRNILGQMDPIGGLNGHGIFKALHYDHKYPAFRGRSLVAGDPLERDVIELLCEMTTSIADVSKNHLEIYPNPAYGSVLISNKEESPVQIEVISMATGSKVSDFTLSGQKWLDLNPGIYAITGRGIASKLVVVH